MFIKREEHGRMFASALDVDFQHELFSLMFDGKLYHAPLNEVHRALDVGCGTGMWAIDFDYGSSFWSFQADQHPECQVYGVDVAHIQPSFVPPNASFFIEDVESEWKYASGFDYIHCRFMTGSIHDWDKLFAQLYKHTNNRGHVEIVDIINPMTADDDSLRGTKALEWSNHLRDQFSAVGCPMNSALQYKAKLLESGFVNVEEHYYKWPIGRWPRDPKMKQLGIWSLSNTLNVLVGLSLRIFTRSVEEGGLGWLKEELDVYLACVRKDLMNPQVHAYWNIRVVYAEKKL
ncbi:Methyltransferase [Tolypocladium paradoxum]|uniref:Methyltransferase n=1 Tax=Tolypocladium paradoxum TaxID=94208 RepID=A0A2S4L8C8_9HYPO|nr:Methyltransferase [Tolypocladium paradoxum]